MKLLETIGERGVNIQYVDRPTVKVVITRDDDVLILQNGLLPGGGVKDGESTKDAIVRELLEELGVTVDTITEIGQVNQFRSFLGKEYEVYGYTARFIAFNTAPKPQDEGEASFTYQWMSKRAALDYVAKLIENDNAELVDDSIQGKRYNLMTSLALLKNI